MGYGPAPMPWRQFEFRDKLVYVRVLDTGKPIVRRGYVELRYKLGATKSYKTAPENLEEVPESAEIIADDKMGGRSATAQKSAMKTAPDTPIGPDTVVIYTDGACSGNPGPAGVGVYVIRKAETVELSEYIGSGTNNIAELKAIQRGLEELTDDERAGHVVLYTDSGWSLGVLVGGWKAKTNLDHIAGVREQMDLCKNLELLKVRGHAGDPGNEEADRLATTAVRAEHTRRRTYPRRG